jgi:hypothetical protein
MLTGATRLSPASSSVLAPHPRLCWAPLRVLVQEDQDAANSQCRSWARQDGEEDQERKEKKKENHDPPLRAWQPTRIKMGQKLLD